MYIGAGFEALPWGRGSRADACATAARIDPDSSLSQRSANDDSSTQNSVRIPYCMILEKSNNEGNL